MEVRQSLHDVPPRGSLETSSLRLSVSEEGNFACLSCFALPTRGCWRRCFQPPFITNRLSARRQTDRRTPLLISICDGWLTRTIPQGFASRTQQQRQCRFALGSRASRANRREKSPSLLPLGRLGVVGRLPTIFLSNTPSFTPLLLSRSEPNGEDVPFGWANHGPTAIPVSFHPPSSPPLFFFGCL